MGGLPIDLGKVREIDGCQFLTIVFINNSLTFLRGVGVKTFETLRDRTAICQTRHGHGSRKPHPVLKIFGENF
jgi:hypothetical protein